MKTNLISAGQFLEKGYEINMNSGVFRTRVEKLGLIAKVDMTAKRMLTLLILPNSKILCGYEIFTMAILVLVD